MGSKYTISILDLIDILNQDMSGTIKSRIEKALPKIFDFDFPIWEASYRPVLEYKIILHYLMKEIGLETPELWKVFLNERLNLIMPYYNELYKSTTQTYDMLVNTKITDTHEESRTRKNTHTDDDSAVAKDIHAGQVHSDGTTDTLGSDLPQANYAGVDYGTNLAKSTDISNGTNNLTIDRTNTIKNTKVDDGQDSIKYTLTRSGLSGSRTYQELILQYRDTIINIDRMVIEELKDLFMMIY